MPASDSTIWEIPPHTLAKHEILKSYLQAWFPILGNFKALTIIDGFCGPGRYAGGEPGSPLIEVEVAKNQIKFVKGSVNFWFVDENSKRLENLDRELSSIKLPPNFKINKKHGKFNQVLEEENDIKNDLKNFPTFVLIDPFGFADIPFSLVHEILSYPQNELMVTFMVDSINRWLEHPDTVIREHIIKYFGTEECLEIAKQSGRAQKLRELYQKQLKNIAGFVRFFEMKNFKNRTIYYLFFATNHKLGFLKMKEAMWNVDPKGEFSFSDATNSGQMILFDTDPLSKLAEIVHDSFEKKGKIACKDVRNFIEDETPYLSKHLTGVLKALENEGKIKVDELKLDGKKRRKGTYPDSARIEFL